MASSSSNLEILAYDETPLGTLCLRRRELLSRPGTVVTEVTINHEFLMSSYYTESERALATSALAKHPGEGLRALVGGLGLGYTTRELLESDRVAIVVTVEFLPEVIGWLRDGLVPLSQELQDDERFEVVQGDVYGRLAAPPTERFDLILIDVDHSPAEPLGDESQVFYSAGGLQAVKRHLEPDGVLAVWSNAEDPAFAALLGEVFARVDSETVSFRNELVDENVTEWLYLAADPVGERIVPA